MIYEFMCRSRQRPPTTINYTIAQTDLEPTTTGASTSALRSRRLTGGARSVPVWSNASVHAASMTVAIAVQRLRVLLERELGRVLNVAVLRAVERVEGRIMVSLCFNLRSETCGRLRWPTSAAETHDNARSVSTSARRH